MLRTIRNFLLFFPFLNRFTNGIISLIKGRSETTIPHVAGNEMKRVAEVLASPGWNMSYGKGLMHERLEEKFAGYIGVRHAVAVNTGGMAIQMALRALGLRPGDEVMHQADTCMANAFAVINAFAAPVFADISPGTFMLDIEDAGRKVSPQTKVVMPIHMWGNPDDMDKALAFANKEKLHLLEDSSLALGAEWKGRKTGSFGIAGIFSFGCLKPVQAGEGGMITTNDESLAKELRTLRSWGEMTAEYGIRDNKELAWNGRMSEIVAAVALGQLEEYPNELETLRSNVDTFRDYLGKRDGLELVDPGENGKSAYNQVCLRINPVGLRMTKAELCRLLDINKIRYWHANFELIPGLQFFKNGHWEKYLLNNDISRLRANYTSRFTNAEKIYESTGIGLNKAHFSSKKSLNMLMKNLDRTLQAV